MAPAATAAATLPPLSALLNPDPRTQRPRNSASTGSSSPSSPRTPLDVDMSFEFDIRSQHSQRRHPPPPLALDRPERRPSVERRSISSLLNGGSSRQSPTEKDPSTSATTGSHPAPLTPHHEYPVPPPHYHAHSHSGEMRSGGYYPPPAPRDHRPITAPIAPPPPGYYKGLDRRHSYQPGPPPSDYFSPPQHHSPPGPPVHPGHPYPPPPHHGPAPFYEASHAIPFETGARAPISRTTKACNGCRERKVRCDAGGQPGGGGVCSRCRESGRECKYSATQKKRGPMPGRAGRARRTSLEDGLLRQPQPPSWSEYPRYPYSPRSPRHEPYPLHGAHGPPPPPPDYFGPGPVPRSPRSAPVVEWWRQEWQDRDPREPHMHRDPREMESPRGRRTELFDPRERDPRDTRPVDPRVDPRAVDPRADPRAVDPRAVDPRDPRAMDPRAVDPRAVDPRAVDPRAVDPRDPRAVDPRAVDPRAVDPRAVDPRDPRADPRLSPRARLSPRSVRLSPRELPYYSPRVSPRMELRPELRDPRDPREHREMPMPPPPHPHAGPHAGPHPGPPPPPHHERDERWDMRPHPAAQWPWRGEVEGRR